MNHWLVKSEPETYSWQQFVSEGTAVWDGVRNYQARNYLMQMLVGDEVLFYHSGKEKAVIGTARVSRSHYPEPGFEKEGWVVVELSPIESMINPVPLKFIKSDKLLNNILLVRQSRLSVMPLNAEAYGLICNYGLPNRKETT